MYIRKYGFRLIYRHMWDGKLMQYVMRFVIQSTFITSKNLWLQAIKSTKPNQIEIPRENDRFQSSFESKQDKNKYY